MKINFYELCNNGTYKYIINFSFLIIVFYIICLLYYKVNHENKLEKYNSTPFSTNI
jgi:hypothetical protein